MRKFLFFLLLIFFQIQSAYSQHFEWAASASNIDLRYTYSSVDANNNIVVGGEGTRNWTHKEEAEIYDGKGNVLDGMNLNNDNNMVLSYSPEGKLNWHFFLDLRYTKLHGIAHDAKGNTVLLVNVLDRFSDENDKPIGLIPEIENEGYEIPAGFYLLHLNSKGAYVKKTRILENNEAKIDLSSFQAYPGGGFVISGFVEKGKICDGVSSSAGPSGGDLLLVLNENGTPKWADVVSYAKGSCCSYVTDMCKAAIAKDGTVYFSGTYMDGGIFGGTVKRTITPPKDANKYYENVETYLASYSPAGKLNWVNTSLTRSVFNSIAVNDKGAFLAYHVYPEVGKSYGLKLDTTGRKNWVVAGFDKSGKARWVATSRVKSFNSIKSDYANNIYLAGEASRGVVGSDTLDEYKLALVASYTCDGKYRWVKQASIPITTSNESLNLFIDDCGNMYLVGTLWFTLPGKMSMWDDAFIKGSGYGAAPFITRFKNTLPKKEGSAEVCSISPGPWKIRNYPNPFRDHTKIEFTLSYADRVTLKIYSMNGELVATLISGVDYETGKYEVDFDGQLAPGIYLATLRGTAMVETCRMVVN